MNEISFSPAEISLLMRRQTKDHVLLSVTLVDLIWQGGVKIVQWKNPNSRSVKAGSLFAIDGLLNWEGLEPHERFVLENGFPGFEMPTSPTAMMSACMEATEEQEFSNLVEQVLNGKIAEIAHSYSRFGQNPFAAKRAGGSGRLWSRLKRKLGFGGTSRSMERAGEAAARQVQHSADEFREGFQTWVAEKNAVKAWQSVNRLGGSLWLMGNVPVDALQALGGMELSGDEVELLNGSGISEKWRNRFSRTAIEGQVRAKEVIEHFFNQKFQEQKQQDSNSSSLIEGALEFFSRL